MVTSGTIKEAIAATLDSRAIADTMNFVVSLSIATGLCGRQELDVVRLGAP